MTSTIKPVLKYPGGKWNIAGWIISHFPPHKHYVEPYFGSGAVFFNKAPTAHEVVNDLSGDVVNLFRVIRERGEELAALIEMTPWAREEWAISKEPTADPVEQARRFLVQNWQKHGHSYRPNSGTWSRTVTAPVDRCRTLVWRQLPDRLAILVSRLRDAEIENQDAAQLIADHAATDVLIYADPPYTFDAGRERLYDHEMADEDHAALLDVLATHPGPVVLSGYHCALYDDRLAHWTTKEKRVQAEKGRMRVEVLWLNPICVERLGYGPMFEVAG